MSEIPTAEAGGWWRPWLVLSSVAVVVLIALVGGGAYYLTHRQSEVSVSWQARAGLSPQDKHSIASALTVARDAGQPVLSTDGYAGQPQFVITRVQRVGGWAILNAAVRVPSGSAVVATEPLFFIAQHSGTGWSLSFPGSTRFCEQLRMLPAGLQDPGQNQYFGC